MAMGVSSQTKPSCAIFWSSTSSSRSSSMASRSLWDLSRKALLREGSCGLHDNCGTFVSMIGFSSSHKLKQNSRRNIQLHNGNYRLYTTASSWKLEVLNSYSSARMVINLPSQVNTSGGSVSYSPQLMEQEKEQVPRDLPMPGASDWRQAQYELYLKKAVFFKSNYSSMDSGISHAKTTSKSGQHEVVDAQDIRFSQKNEGRKSLIRTDPASYPPTSNNNSTKSFPSRNGCLVNGRSPTDNGCSGISVAKATAKSGQYEVADAQDIQIFEKNEGSKSLINNDPSSGPPTSTNNFTKSFRSGNGCLVNGRSPTDNGCSGISVAKTTAKSGQYDVADAQDIRIFEKNEGSKSLINNDPSSGPLTSTNNFTKSFRSGNGCLVNGRSPSLVPSLIDKDLASSPLTSNKNATKSSQKQHLNNTSQAKGIKSNGSIPHIDSSILRERLAGFYDRVLVVDNLSMAREVVRMLTDQYRDRVYACDTEVAKIDVKQETPVDHGEIICFSIYCGSEANFGDGKSCIWVDVLEGGGKTILAEFAPFFEDPSIRKVWHNYSFDNHVIENYGLKVSGFHADTMHMARLWDSSRRTEGGYSLEALTGDPRVCCGENLIGKVSMKTIFGRKKVKKDGSEGKIVAIPPVEDLQIEERKLWISYSALDSISTLKLYESLKSKLLEMEWKLDGHTEGTMLEFYEKYWRPFGQLLVRMETEGMLIDKAYLAEVEKVARAEQQVAANRFRNWASKKCPDARYMNVGSDAQLRQLFFGGIVNSKDPAESLPEERDFKVPNVEKVIEEGKTTPTKYRNIKLRRLGPQIETDMYTPSGWPSVSGDALKTLAGKVSAEFVLTDDIHQVQLDDSIVNSPGTEAKEGGSEGREHAYGTAYNSFGGGQDGKEACHAIAALCEVCSIDSLISNFILPLQGSHISGKNGRIHCSLNINTETGRLSARRPNLQNQPALEKDRYRIRQAFVAAPGNSLIVADYGQLELRILAHLAGCKSMLDAFKAGGDFHSRTAMNMYSHIREAVEKKHVLLEWHPQPGEDKPPVPLLKDAFASERRKAKMLNFSIAYGKTAVGLSHDWKVSVNEARETVDRWYNDRQEVQKWQRDRKKEARNTSRVHTLLGRARLFPNMDSVTSSQKNHIERAAINTPVQGSAADVAMCAMLEISKNTRLKELGWRLLLQVHDEVILEGPTESAEEAKVIVVECMSKPFDGKNFLKVDLSVDAKCAQNWYSAK